MADPFQSNRSSSPIPPQSYPGSSYSRLLQHPPCEDYRTFWCHILGDRQPFKVALPLNADVDIDDLKQVIHIKGVGTTKSTVLSKDLILWKPKEPEPLEPNNTFVNRVRVKFSNLGRVATEPGPSQKLSIVFPQQLPQGCLHVIVQMDTTSAKRSMAEDYSDLPYKRSRSDDWVAEEGTTSNTIDYTQGVILPTCSPDFSVLRERLGRYFVDKTKLIEDIINFHMAGHVDLVLRPRRCGKTTMLHMLKTFFALNPSGSANGSGPLFRGLYISDKPDLCQKHMGKYAVIFCKFQTITGESWDEMLESFKLMVADLYDEWKDYLWDSLDSAKQDFFQSILCQKASIAQWKICLLRLSTFLARKSGQKVMVFIDEYEAPNNRAYEHGFFDKANEFFGRGVLPNLLKSSDNIAYAVLVGVTPVAKAGWYSGLNNLDIHALHRPNSIFAGMLMFTEAEVLKLRALSKSELDPQDLKTHYNSYLAAGCISVYNPVSIMSAFQQSVIENFWVATGEYPLLRRKLPEDIAVFDNVQTLLCKDEISFELQPNVTFGALELNIPETLTLLYYAGYLTMTPLGRFKIPNEEVMADWANWLTGSVESDNDILNICVKGPISTFAERWPLFMQQHLNPMTVAKERGAASFKTPERIYHVYLLGLLHVLRPKGWEVKLECRAGLGNIDIWLLSKKTHSAVLIEVKSSEKPEHIERDANNALKQIVDKNYRNQEGLQNITSLREYGIASYHLQSCVKGRYLELNAQRQWEEKVDPMSYSHRG